jgi:hypothetical protein
VSDHWVFGHLPEKPPSGWVVLEEKDDGRLYECLAGIGKGLRVIVSGNVEADGKPWLHLSASRAWEAPHWNDLHRVRDLFLGADRYAVIVLPPKKFYVNIHPFVLHMWALAEGDWPLPEFSGTVRVGTWTVRSV